MGCMKCGRDTVEDRIFCDTCLEVMKRYPVKPGIAIQLPKRKDGYPLKRTAAPRRRQAPKMEEINRRLRKRVRNLVILWLVTLLLAAAMVYPTIRFVQDMDLHKIGQNYSTFTEDTAETDLDPVSP